MTRPQTPQFPALPVEAPAIRQLPLDPPAPAEIVVQPDGAIVRKPDETVLTVLTTETFAAEIDLNALRNDVHQSQMRGETTPGDLRVTQDGRIVRDGRDDMAARLSKETFAMLPSVAAEARVARTQLPVGTYQQTVGRTTGWVYTFFNEFADQYTFFTYYSTQHQQYRTMLVAPNLNGLFGEHQAHLYSDGTVCLSPNVGVATLDGSYARAVLWSNGVSVVRRGGEFPFTYDQ